MQIIINQHNTLAASKVNVQTRYLFYCYGKGKRCDNLDLLEKKGEEEGGGSALK